MIKKYFKIAWRNALKNRTYTLISLFSLVLGITLFFLISIWIKDELSHDKGFKSPEKICRVETTTLMQDGTTDKMQAVGWPVGKTLEAKYPEIQSLTYMRNWYPIILHKETHFYENAFYADKSFMDVFGYELQQGDAASALVEPFSLVISKELAQKYFGTENAIGKVLMINDTVPYKITGVFKDLKAPSHLNFSMVGSFSTFCSLNPKACEQEFAKGWFDVNVYNYIRLAKDAKPALVESKIKNLILEYGKEAVEQHGFKATLSLTPVTDIYLHSGLPTGKGTIGNFKTVRLFLIIGIFILLIAGLNFINLTTARSTERAREIGVRKVLGSDRKKLILQFLAEAAFLCIVAAIISVTLIVLLLPAFNQFTGKELTTSTLFSTGNILLLSGILIALIPLAGFYPSLVLSGFRPAAVLKGNFSHSTSGTVLRKTLVVTQFAISAGLIMATFVMWKQMRYMQNQNLGFDKERLLLTELDKVPWKLRHEKAQVFKTALLNKPGIKNITACGAVPGRNGWNGQFAYPEGKPNDQGVIIEYISVDVDYLKTIAPELIAGRDFMPDSKKDAEEAFIINEASVKLFGWGTPQNALGKQLSTSGKEGQIIGVVKDYHQHGLQEKINAIVLSPVTAYNLFALKYEGISPQQAIANVQDVWKEVFASYPLSWRFLDDDFQRQYQKEEKIKSFFSLAAILSVVIACMGLLGLAIYIAQKRVKEIGVRKVLGASVAGIVFLISKDLLKLVCIAIVIAIPVAWISMNSWLQGFAYRIPIQWWLFAIAGIAAIMIAFITVGLQAARAAMANPVKSLRTE